MENQPQQTRAWMDMASLCHLVFAIGLAAFAYYGCWQDRWDLGTGYVGYAVVIGFLWLYLWVMLVEVAHRHRNAGRATLIGLPLRCQSIWLPPFYLIAAIVAFAGVYREMDGVAPPEGYRLAAAEVAASAESEDAAEEINAVGEVAASNATEDESEEVDAAGEAAASDETEDELEGESDEAEEEEGEEEEESAGEETAEETLRLSEDEVEIEVETKPQQNQRLADNDYLYFSVATITTVGYGDFRPDKPESRWMTIFQVATGLLILVCTFPLVISRISQWS